MSDTPITLPAPGSPSDRNILTPITQEMQDSYLTYAMSVIMARALPDVRDGLKPSQRRIFVAMNDLNLSPRAKHRKCAKICGDTSGNYHPHGEGVIYPTLVRMGQEWALRYTLVDPQGNFGSIDDDPPAAMRYTEARLAGPAEEMLTDLERDTVDFEDNYDGTRKEPVVLPSKFPNLLVNGSEGIAVGMATRLSPHNLGEICDAICAYIANESITVDELMRHVPGPDFPTGGVIHGTEGIRRAYETGRGSIVVRGVMRVEETKTGKITIIVDEIPYGVLLPTIKDRINEGVENGTIKGVDDVLDQSGREALVRLVISLKRDANVNVVMNQLWEYTPLQSTIHVMNVVLVNRVPKELNLKQLIEHYVAHREDVIRRRTQFLLRKARQRGHVLEGLILAVADIDEIIQLIKQSPDVETARERLMQKPLRLSESATVRRLLPEKFVERAATDQFLTRTQADAILAMQLRRLTGLEIEQLAKEYGEVVEEITGYELILSDRRRILDIIDEDLREMKEKYGDKRRTRITGELGSVQIEQLIEQEQVVVTISHESYIKRVPIDTYRSQGRGGKGIRGTDAKDGDFIEHMHVCSTHDYLLFFTNRGRIYWLRVFDIPSLQRTSRGRAIANVLTMQTSEVVMAILPVTRFEEEKYVFFATQLGVVKKTPLAAFANPRAGGIAAIALDDGDSLVGVAVTNGDDQIVLGTRQGMACRFREEDVRAMGRAARGVWGIDLEKEDAVVDLVVIKPGMSVLTVCERGFGKRTDIDAYRLTRRGGKGVINSRVTDKTGLVVALRSVTDEDALMLITAKGTLLKMTLDQLREIGRATQGVKLIRVDDDDRVVAVAKAVVDKDENGAEGNGANGEDTGEAAPPADEPPAPE